MRITVKTFATLREIFGGTGMLYLELPEGSTIEDLLKKLEEQYGSRLDISRLVGENPNVKVLVNGREIMYLDGLRTRLRDGDSVAFIPPVAGG
ncbi:MAG: MoaD/ThiS family protein [Nitrososphaerota archaeon]